MTDAIITAAAIAALYAAAIVVLARVWAERGAPR